MRLHAIKRLVPKRVKEILWPPKYRMQPEFTNHCNFMCRFCPQSRYRQPTEGGNVFDRKKGYMSEELFEIFLDNAHRYASHVIIGFFGEQMLHPRFEQFMQTFPRSRPYSVVLFTNWSLATRQNMDSLKNADNVRISMDASCSEVFEELRSGGAVLDLDGHPTANRYETLVQKLDYWLKLSDRPQTTLKYVVSSVNETDRDKFVAKFVPKLKQGDDLVTKSVISYGGAMRDSYMSEHPCTVPDEYRLTVAWNGDCSPCNLDVNMALKIGNLLENKDMKTMFQQRCWRDVLAAMRRHEGVCANCFDANNHTRHIRYEASTEPQQDG